MRDLSIVMERQLAGGQCSVLLISHDFRGESADANCLNPIFDRLKAKFAPVPAARAFGVRPKGMP